MIKADFFPTGIAVCSAEPWMWEKPVFAAEEQMLSVTAADKRQREFRAGRHCAHAALAQLGYSDTAVLRGERGEPLWPSGICGSISHAGERCVAIAALKSAYLSIAVDIEKDRPIKDDTLERISHPAERRQLEQAPVDFQHLNLRAILFSAKECVHKIYYPLNQHTLDFHDVELHFDWDKQSFMVQVLNPVPDATVVVEQLKGRFGWESNYVYTQICLEAGR